MQGDTGALQLLHYNIFLKNIYPPGDKNKKDKGVVCIYIVYIHIVYILVGGGGIRKSVRQTLVGKSMII